MRILHLISSSGYYGAENVLLLLARNLTSCGRKCVIGVFRDERDPHIEVAEHAKAHALETEIISCCGRADWNTVRQIRNIVHKRGFDVLHAHGYKTDLYAYAAARRSRAALVSTCHAWQGTEARMYAYAAIDRLVLRRFDRIAGVCDSISDTLTSWGVERSKVATIFNGIEVARFRNAKPEARASMRGTDRHLIGMIARLAPEKGGAILLQAAPSVLAAFPNTTFALIGGGPARREWEAMAARLGILDHVVFTGVRSDMPEVYASLDMVVLPSFNEGLPMCLLEAMAAGRPTIATPVGSVSKLVIPGRTGLLVPAGDVAGLAGAIAQLLRDPVKARRLGENARTHVTAFFSPERMARGYIRLYESALAESSARKQKRERSLAIHA